MVMIKGTVTKKEAFEVSVEEITKAFYGVGSLEDALQVVKARILKAYDIDHDHAYIANSKWCYDEEVWTSHSFEITNTIRDATPEEETVMQLLKSLTIKIREGHL